VKDATNTLGDDLEGAGKPDTESGEEAKETVDDLRSSLDENVGTIEDAIDNASDTGIATAVSTVSATLATMRTEITAAVDKLKQLDADDELRSALSDAEACSSLSQQ
jgi:hypothetical protein